jgi:translocation and assembly module TamB
VDSYTDYQDEATQNKTQVDVSASKKLFNDQLIVQVGSGVSIEENSGPNQQNTPVVGNVSLEYLFTEDGKWRIKGFRKNEFENVIEGQLIVTGISIIFQKEFNKFNELLEEVKQHQNAEKKTD